MNCRLTAKMKFFKIFKKKPPPKTIQSSNLICNIHWAEVQKELSEGIKETNSQMVSNNKNVSKHGYKETSPRIVGNKNIVKQIMNHNTGWNSSGDDDNMSSERNSWSSISLTSSTKTSSVEPFPEENFSR